MKSILENNSCFGPAMPFSQVSLVNSNKTLNDIKDYGDRIMFASISPYLNQSCKILDLGCGARIGFMGAVLKQGCNYTGVDFDPNVFYVKHSFAIRNKLLGLAEFILQDINNFVELLEANSYDVVILGSVLGHQPKELIHSLIEESYRVAAKAVFIQEASYNRLGNIEQLKLFKDFLKASDMLIDNHGKITSVYNKIETWIEESLPKTKFETFLIDDRPEGDYSEELSLWLEGAKNCLDYCYYGDNCEFISDAIDNLSSYLSSGKAHFTPCAFMMTHIPKVS